MSLNRKEKLNYEINEDTFNKSYPSKWEEKIREEVYSDKFVLINEKPEIWVYMGSHGDHLLLGTQKSAIYCSCKGFRISLERKDNQGCSHIYALNLLKPAKKFRNISKKLSQDDLIKIIEEIMEIDYSYLLRTKLLEE
ncbi:MAG: hypothetical protein ACP5I6_02215 [Caldisphaera sp.]|jgi:predicted nucleic acid-binding Zn finger protein|nr:SWIM zinc finger family protein [Caldisphaera sp.]PMP60608.1 MAG: hypothetical protein C0201_02270 [Caldisphaera sp.]PMP89802.1 MAG: hypothetical protein C0171_06460 [Caldisphaera sp.]